MRPDQAAPNVRQGKSNRETKPTYVARFGGKEGQTLTLVESSDLLVVRTRSRTVIDPEEPTEYPNLSREAAELLAMFEQVDSYELAGVAVLRARVRRGAQALRDKARQLLKREESIWFAGRVLVDEVAKQPVLYTENLFIKFQEDAKESDVRRVLRDHALAEIVKAAYAPKAYFVKPPEGIGLDVFGLAQQLLELPEVELCHPELIRRPSHKRAFEAQWHLRRTTINGKTIDAHASVEAAWELSQGEGVTIAVIDDGFDVDHEEFRGAGKIVAPRDVSRGTNDPRPGNLDNHGTPCAGVAVANGAYSAAGVAPKARLMPIRLVSGLGSRHEADAFVWAAQNGADVISCSWGPPDGDWRNPKDPRHKAKFPLPDSTRLAIDFAVNSGRNGKGCVICFAAGNGNESVDNDGYASYEKVIAVAACNDMGMRAAYSDYGKAIWCAFPSNHGLASLTPGIWTTDRSGAAGRNPGNPRRGDEMGNYTNDFGGTSSACPGVAGVAALILARNPELHWDEVREIIKNACDKIDPANGQYNDNGHSPYYGYGRVNARRAVELAFPAQRKPIVRAEVRQDVPIPDLGEAKVEIAIGESRALQGLRVIVDIEHAYIGDLVLTLHPPEESKLQPVVLYNRSGGSRRALRQTFDPVNTPALKATLGASPQGVWTLVARDKAKRDTGKIRAFALEMEF
ncbi:MAG: S8 family serine peptidase [Anaerolineae bacterium]|nr:S8 family serine peptidase [Thermoflexales bacterium]MDW8293592.1 S8 family serine peptidase [Anaerolineae bacterium]